MIVKILKLVFVFSVFSFLGYLYFKYDPINTLLFPKCPLFVTTGIYCPGCGSQRATHALLHFEIFSVLKSNLLFLPIVLLIMYHFGIYLVNQIMGTQFQSVLDYTKAPLIILVIVLCFWLLRNIPFFPFTHLVP